MKTFTLNADTFCDLIAQQAARFNSKSGVGNPADPTRWYAFSAYIYRMSPGPLDERVYYLEVNQAYGTEIKVTWLPPRCPEDHPAHRRMARVKGRVKVNAWYDRQWPSGSPESRPLTQEHVDMLLEFLVEGDLVTWHSKRPTTILEEALADWVLEHKRAERNNVSGPDFVYGYAEMLGGLSCS